jgi:glycine cleavage system regulatory protein
MNRMNVEFIVSLLGDDRKGLIPFLEEHTHEHRGQWRASKFSQLSGQFAAVIRINVPQEHEQSLKAFFSAQQDMAVRFGQVKKVIEESGKALKLNIEAKDQHGLINKITHRLDSLGVAITHLECRHIAVIDIGGSLLSIDISINLPENLSETALIGELESLGEHLVVTFNE